MLRITFLAGMRLANGSVKSCALWQEGGARKEGRAGRWKSTISVCGLRIKANLDFRKGDVKCEKLM